MQFPTIAFYIPELNCDMISESVQEDTPGMSHHFGLFCPVIIHI